jgi:hypothetical protein
MIRYVQVKAPQGDHRAIALSKKLRMDLIELPEEYKDISIDDYQTQGKRKRPRIMKTRTSTNLANYDAWRCHDRYLLKTGGK